MRPFSFWIPLSCGALVAAALVSPAARAHDATDELAANPWAPHPSVPVWDLSEEGRARDLRVVEPVEQDDFWSLDERHLAEGVPAERALDAPNPDAQLPDGWVQAGDVVYPPEGVDGLKVPDPDPLFSVEDIPGNKYPRKTTVFLNFNGAMLTNGTDNSAENVSSLAKNGMYPVFGGSQSIALSIIQAIQNDMAPYGIQVVYEKRPPKIVPYTMVMVGGTWQDTNLSMPAGGVAPGADCGALGQRHIVYAFTNGGSVTIAANTASQEAGHAWGLDHTFNCNSVMSYCATGDGSFQTTCDDLCENQCQGAAGCPANHMTFCPAGGQQNDDAEMSHIHGSNGEDTIPPTVSILSPDDGTHVAAGSTVQLRAMVDDDFGGFGWAIKVEQDGKVIQDSPDYFKDFIDDQYRVAVDLAKLTAGTYVLTVTAQDQYEHVTEDSVTVYVGDANGTGGSGGSGGSSGPVSGGTSGGSATSGPATGGGSGSAGSGGSGGSGSSTGNEASNGGGCGCASPGRSPDWGVGLLVVGLGATLGRRRMRISRACQRA